jgi:hypothetical protein
MSSASNQAAFRHAFTTIATVAPIALIVYAFLADPDSLERARIVVQGCEQIVVVLVGLMAIRAAYLLGVRKSASDAHSHSSLAG